MEVITVCSKVNCIFGVIMLMKFYRTINKCYVTVILAKLEFPAKYPSLYCNNNKKNLGYYKDHRVYTLYINFMQFILNTLFNTFIYIIPKIYVIIPTAIKVLLLYLF